jgi:hypothetical protein
MTSKSDPDRHQRPDDERRDLPVSPIEGQIDRFLEAANRLDCNLSLDRLAQAIAGLAPPRGVPDT